MGTHTRTSSKAAAVLAALSTIVFIAGCGTSNSTDQEAPATEVSTSAAATEEPTAESSESPSPEPSPEASPETSAMPTEDVTEKPTALETSDAQDGSCTAADLSATVETPMGAGSAGTAQRTLILSNTSNEECTMAGYPGVSYVDATETQVGAPADREAGLDTPTVVLEPGQSAVATLQQTNAQNYGDACMITDTTGVLVYPPGATDALVAPQESVGCAAEDIILMTVGPMVTM